MMKKISDKKISVEDIINQIPDDLIRKLSTVTNVDFQVKKLYGRSVFYLLLYGILDSTRASLRNLEDIFNSAKFSGLGSVAAAGARQRAATARLVAKEA